MHPILIIGAGPVGLSAALSLAKQGIASLVIEKHPGTSIHPKARGINGRTMELFRSWGVEEALRAYAMPKEAHRFTWIEDFQGSEITRVQATVDYSLYSPSAPALISQDIVEKVLLEKAKTVRLITFRFETELKSIFQDKHQVSIEVLNKNTNKIETLTAPYLIAADGAHSTVREVLGIEMEGKENLGEYCNIYCEANLDKYVKHRPSVGFVFTKPELMGTFVLSKDGSDRWLFGLKLQAAEDLKRSDLTDEFCVNYVKKVINDNSIDVKLINKSFWTMAALIAKQYRIGKIFLAGDAAHRLPPTGGFGMNTGIQDAHNLAWKLAMVIREEASDALLDSYFTERVQVAKTNMLWSLNNARRFESIFKALVSKDYETFKAELADQTHHINNILFDLGFIYGDEYEKKERYQPSAAIGARAPHCWLSKGESRISTLDLFNDNYVLLCHPKAKQQHSQLPYRCITIGDKGEYLDINDDFLKRYEISEKGAVLVRPDGHVAWRAD